MARSRRGGRDSGRPGADTLRLLNLGPKSTAWLADIGIHHREQLVRIGTIEACRRLRQAGHPVTLLAAYAIEAGLMDVPWTALPVEFKRQLVIDYGRMERETTAPVRKRA